MRKKSPSRKRSKRGGGTSPKRGNSHQSPAPARPARSNYIINEEEKTLKRDNITLDLSQLFRDKSSSNNSTFISDSRGTTLYINEDFIDIYSGAVNIQWENVPYDVLQQVRSILLSNVDIRDAFKNWKLIKGHTNFEA